jgi:hypothetical protein
VLTSLAFGGSEPTCHSTPMLTPSQTPSSLEARGDDGLAGMDSRLVRLSRSQSIATYARLDVFVAPRISRADAAAIPVTRCRHSSRTLDPLHRCVHDVVSFVSNAAIDADAPELLATYNVSPGNSVS